MLDQTLVKLRVMPHRKFTTPAAFREAIEDLVHRFRNHRDAFDDDVFAFAAGLWNFNLVY
jgi:hypothetical protein